MGIFVVLLSFFVLTDPAPGPTPVTVEQLEQFLTSPRMAKLSDEKVAERLGHVVLAEQLTPGTLARIESETSLGAETADQLEFLSASSMFEVPPQAELPKMPEPSAARQEQMLEEAHAYVDGELRLLPNFLAARKTRSFDNTPVLKERHSKPKVELHLVREYRREIAYRNGREVIGANGDGNNASAGFSTWGEFGAILRIVLSDSFSGSVAWNRWQTSDSGAPVAVFRYAIPQSSSHYAVDFCCYKKSEDDPAVHDFHDKPGYHGEIYIDPSSGVIDRITLQADLDGDSPMTKSGIAVQYGKTTIDGKAYVCPVRSVAVSEIHNRSIQKIDGIGLERHLNEVEFLNYHKFGSTMRIVTEGSGRR